MALVAVAGAAEQPRRPIAVLKCNFDLRSSSAKGFVGVRGDFPNVHKLKVRHSERRRESGYAMSALRDEVESPNAVAKPLVKLVPEADHHVHRVDGVGTRIGPISPIVLAIGASEGVHLKALRHCGLVAR